MDPAAIPIGLPAVLPAARFRDVRFEGFRPEAFDILERLREEPHVERYRQEKEAVARHLNAPFRRYRDDLVANAILPLRIGLETERNVFSRLLKNDFGAGGCRHHLWMAFYRPGRTRLRDVQWAHSIHPDSFCVSVYVARHLGEAFRQARDRIAAAPDVFLETVNEALLRGGITLEAEVAGTKNVWTAPLADPPEGLHRLQAIDLAACLGREEVVAAGPDLVEWAWEASRALWPFYHFLIHE
jgi:hypothetical protein